ncbi:hypothetical protein L248_3045 [Schleiferilactobacillus shenzhenensis LY-73]|uniref:Uncharacterized protein n=1 Tax=Schleiferilactobacillus shenzhenensis LY-73 TaxID=1231336 RepID=U4TUJ9_9LACO|nr:hypothetical protein L248_3045 [Schleiferilactobacillus shenzhenensis LY-73]
MTAYPFLTGTKRHQPDDSPFQVGYKYIMEEILFQLPFDLFVG